MGFFFSTWGDLPSWHKMDLVTERKVDFGAGRNGECKICGQREKLLQSAKGTCDWGNGIVEALHPQCDLLGGGGRGKRAQLNISCKENCEGTPLKVPSENHSLPFFSPFLAWGLSAHSPPRPGAELAIP